METVNAKTAVTLVCLGFMLIAVSIPLYLGKIKMNCFYGFRIRKAFESEENWYKINRYGAKVLMWWSVVIVAMGIACLFIEPQSGTHGCQGQLHICDCPHYPNLPVRKAVISRKIQRFRRVNL